MAIPIYCIVLTALLIFPQTCAHSAREALTIWGLHVVPSLYPYMVFSKMLCEQIKHTPFPPALVCSLLGILGGSPSGAAMIQSYRSRLSSKTVFSLICLTGTISPMFFLGTVKSWTGDSLLCRQLLVSQYSGALLTAGFSSLFSLPLPAAKSHAQPDFTEHKSPLAQSIDAILQIGGSIICLSVIASLFALLPFPNALSPVIHALLEISGGAHAIVRFPFSARMQGILLAFVTGFGGFCILLQNLLFLRPIGVSLKRLLSFAFTRGLFSSFVMFVMLMF